MVDWTDVPLTKAAANTKDPASNVRVVVVPRGVFARYGFMDWAELEQAAARGDDGLTRSIVKTVDRPQSGHAFMRSGYDTVGLKDRSLLFIQGW